MAYSHQHVAKWIEYQSWIQGSVVQIVLWIMEHCQANVSFHATPGPDHNSDRYLVDQDKY